MDSVHTKRRHDGLLKRVRHPDRQSRAPTAKDVISVIAIVAFLLFAFAPIAVLIHRHGWGMLF